MINKEAISLMTVKGFMTEYFNNLAGLTPKEAYERTEESYYSHFGKNKYSGYDVFKVMLCKYVKSLKKVN